MSRFYTGTGQLGTGAKRTLGPDIIARLPAEILNYLASDPARLMRFFDITGLDPASLRKAAGEAGFESSLLDYLGSDETLLREFSEQHGYDPAAVDHARMILAGPQGDG